MINIQCNQLIAAIVRLSQFNSAFQPSRESKLSTGVRRLAQVKAGCVHLYRVAGNTVQSHMASDIP